MSEEVIGLTHKVIECEETCLVPKHHIIVHLTVAFLTGLVYSTDFGGIQGLFFLAVMITLVCLVGFLASQVNMLF